MCDFFSGNKKSNIIGDSFNFELLKCIIIHVHVNGKAAYKRDFALEVLKILGLSKAIESWPKSYMHSWKKYRKGQIWETRLLINTYNNSAQSEVIIPIYALMQIRLKVMNIYQNNGNTFCL